MSDTHHQPVRVIVAAVMNAKSKSVEALAKGAADVAQKAGVTLVRSVVVKGERQYMRQLISHVANDNEADVILMLGGAGIGPKDDTCEAIDGFVERRMEGFGDAYRRLIEVEIGVAHAMLARATAGVYNQCVVYAMTGRVSDITRAMEALIVPTLGEAVELAAGRKRAGEAHGA